MKWFSAGTLCMALMVACGASKQRSAMVAPPSSAESGQQAPQAMPSDPRADIESLFAQVEQKRTELGLPEPQAASSARTAAEPMATVPSSSDATCKPAKTERCTQSCTFSDEICTNAGHICDIASKMPADAWAAGKCDSAKQTCQASHDSCCGCQ